MNDERGVPKNKRAAAQVACAVSPFFVSFVSCRSLTFPRILGGNGGLERERLRDVSVAKDRELQWMRGQISTRLLNIHEDTILHTIRTARKSRSLVRAG